MVDGTAGRGPRAGQLDGQVTLRGLDLTLLHGLPGVPAGLAGRVDATIDARGGGRGLAGKLAVNATALVVRPGSIPVDVTATADLGPHGLRLGLAARGHALGSLAATARLTPPRRLEDRAAWRRLKRTAIDELQVRARALDLARLAELAGGAPRVEGMVDADVDVTGAGGTIAIHGRGLIVAGAPTPLDLDLDVDLADPANVAVVAHGTLRELGAVTMTTALALPARPFDPGAWRALDLRSLRAIDVTVDEVIVDEARARRLGLPDVRGRLAATIHVEPGLAGVTAHVDGRDLIAGRLARPATITVDSRVDRAGTHVTLAMGLGGRAVATGELTVPLGLDRMTVGALDLGALPLSGTFEIARTPIGALMGALGQARGIGGQVHGHLDVAGSVGAPSATVALVVDDLGGRGRLGPDGRGRVRAPLHTMAIDARYQDGAVDGSIRGEAADGGSLAMVVDFDPAAPAAARVSLIAHRFQLGPLARLLPAAPIGVRGVLDADLQLRGLAVASARLGGEARVTGFQVPLADTLDALRDGTLDVTLRGDDLRVNLAGTVGSGQVKAVATAHLVGLIPDRGDLDLTVDHLELITASAPQLAGTIHLEVARDHDRYRAVARIHDAEVVVPERAGRLLHPASLPPDLIFTSELRSGVALPRSRATALRSWIGVRPTHPVLQLAVHIERVTVVSDQLRGDVTGELAILAGDDGAVVDGRIGVSRGKVMLFERRYGVRRADVAFDGGIDPLLDIQLEYEFPQLTMRIALGGRLSKPVLHLSADPNTYTEGQLLAILLGGSPGTPGSENPAFVSGVAAAAASQLVGGYVARKLPVRLDVINYEGVTAVSSSAFVVGRWITSEILLLLRIRIDARPNENVNEAEVELWLAPHLLFEGTAGDRGVLGADLLWNRRW